ncbi:MAG: MCE family protein [Puniceicoccales bacterium]|jgi:hypothetical protein|nr:MCE family protein [Puniceicoccales bacterium]
MSALQFQTDGAAGVMRLGRLVLLVSALLAVAAVLAWRAAAPPAPVRVALYFEHGVEGLSNGSPVKSSGVEIGRVEDIGLRLAGGKPFARVVIALEARKLGRGGVAALGSPAALERGARSGLHAKLAVLSPATAQNYIEIAHDAASGAKRLAPGGEKLPELPVLPPAVTAEKLDSLAQRLLAFGARDFAAEAAAWDAALDKALAFSRAEKFAAVNANAARLDAAARILGDPALRADLALIERRLGEFRVAAGGGGGSAGGVDLGGAAGALAEFRGALERTGARAAVVAAALSPVSEEMRELTGNLAQARAFAEELRDLAERWNSRR